MKAIAGLENEPIFCPIVSDFYSGMLVTVPVFKKQLKKGSIDEIKALYAAKYNGEIVKYQDALALETENGGKAGFMSSVEMSGSDTMLVTVDGNEERILLMAAYDNLGKGASGAAIECMNLVMGADRKTGLIVTKK